MAPVDNASLPAAVRVPAGETQKMWTVGSGEITYECREKKDDGRPARVGLRRPGRFAQGRRRQGRRQVLRRPDLGIDRRLEGDREAGRRRAAAAGNLPLQLVKADPRPGWAQCRA
jgi:hypothetical protein